LVSMVVSFVLVQWVPRGHGSMTRVTYRRHLRADLRISGGFGPNGPLGPGTGRVRARYAPARRI